MGHLSHSPKKEEEERVWETSATVGPLGSTRVSLPLFSVMRTSTSFSTPLCPGLNEDNGDDCWVNEF